MQQTGDKWSLRQVRSRKRVTLGRTRLGLAAKVPVNGLHTLRIRSVCACVCVLTI